MRLPASFRRVIEVLDLSIPASAVAPASPICLPSSFTVVMRLFRMASSRSRTHCGTEPAIFPSCRRLLDWSACNASTNGMG